MAHEMITSDDAVTIKSEGYSVRAAMENGQVLFACRDVLTLCGYRFPEKAAKRMAENDRFGGTIKMIAYPFYGSRGMRRIKMYFGDADAVREIIASSAVKADVRRWLEDTVHTYWQGVDTAQKKDPAEKVDNTEPETTVDTTNATMNATTNEMNGYERLNKSIDRILIELIEIKKNLITTS